MDGFDPSAIASTYGGWVFATVVAGWVITAFIRGDIVPGKWLVAMTSDRDYYRNKLETQTNQLLGVTEALADRATQARLLRQRDPEVR